MNTIEHYIDKRTLIIGDVKTGKTDLSLKILLLFLKAGYANKIAILDLAPGSINGIGRKMPPPPKESLLYLTASISAPRLTGKDEDHTRQLAEENARTIERLFVKFQRQKREILFVNDATLYLQAGHLNQFVEILDTTSTQIINAYFGNAFTDSELTRREKKLTENLIKICDPVIKMSC